MGNNLKYGWNPCPHKDLLDEWSTQPQINGFLYDLATNSMRSKIDTGMAIIMRGHCVMRSKPVR